MRGQHNSVVPRDCSLLTRLIPLASLVSRLQTVRRCTNGPFVFSGMQIPRFAVANFSGTPGTNLYRNSLQKSYIINHKRDAFFRINTIFYYFFVLVVIVKFFTPGENILLFKFAFFIYRPLKKLIL